ncbi:MAG: hypothetical protein H7330_04305 [Hymenobacteraceae bacterium]|nr:hypothetical protein [Hymenobacteraceae bacterium]
MGRIPFFNIRSRRRYRKIDPAPVPHLAGGIGLGCVGPKSSKDATVKLYHYQTTAQLNDHLQAFLLAYNHAKRLKTLNGLTPHQFVCAEWHKNKSVFSQEPTSFTLGLYSPALDVRALPAGAYILAVTLPNGIRQRQTWPKAQ